ncbi:contractile injection system tape measure protein [Mucilaginibacter sp. NFX135]|uniref:contractile injection system tape measure protein n=1 Tax=Mucilaginibacter sp. NFX135 TaxID=3402687 RepID=UPI003AFADF1C
MASHIVHRQQVTLNLPKREEALVFQNRVSDLLRNELSASMEAIFDELFPTTDIIRIDSLHLDLGKIEAHNFEQEFKTHFIKELRKILPSKKNELADKEQALSPKQSSIKAFIYFLENGYLPWYSPVKNMTDWGNEIITAFSDSEKKASHFFNWFCDNYVDNPVILQRLILQFSNTFLEKLFSIIAPGINESWSLIYSDLEIFITHCVKKDLPVREQIWMCVFHALLSPEFLENNKASSNTKNSKRIIKTLNLLVDRFNISSQEVTIVLENKLKRLLQTDVVKNALQDLKSFLKSKESFRNDTEDKTVIDRRKETEVNNDYENIEEIRKSKQTDANRANQAKNSDATGSNKDKKTNETKTDDATNDLNNIDIQKSPYDVKQKDIRAEKIQEEQKNNKVHHSNDLVEARLKQQTKIEEKQENQKIGHPDNQDEISLRQQEKIETEEERSEKNKQGDNTKRLLPQNKRYTGIKESETLYIKSSGIVILHYFLSPYFDDLGLLTDGKFKDDTAHQRAVLLLYYLATGESEVAEFDLTLSKILCGYPISETLPSAIILTRKEKTESKRLLEAIINHWSPLKNTSIKGLRNGFFERDGKLTKKENGWLLTVEQRTIDVLLGKLPWGYSTIRLLWMQEILNVDWY